MTEEMRLREVLEDSNPVSILFKIFVMLVGGICLNWIEIFPVDWLMPLLCVGIYFTKLALAFVQSSAEEKGYDVEKANAYAKQKHFEAKQAESKAGELQTLLKQANEKLKDNESIAKALEDERATTLKLKSNIDKQKQYLLEAQSELDKQQELLDKFKAIAEKEKDKAVSDALKRSKALLPYKEYYSLMQEKATIDGIKRKGQKATADELAYVEGREEALKDELKSNLESINSLL